MQLEHLLIKLALLTSTAVNVTRVVNVGRSAVNSKEDGCFKRNDYYTGFAFCRCSRAILPAKIVPIYGHASASLSLCVPNYRVR